MNHRRGEASNQRKSPVLDTVSVAERCSLTSDTLSRLLALGTVIETSLARQLRPWRMTLGEFQILRASGHRGRRQVELSHELQRSKVTVCRQVKKLLEQGYLQQDIDVADQRAKWLCVTPEGERVRCEAHRALSRTMRQPALSLDSETRAMLEKMLRNVSAWAQRPEHDDSNRQTPEYRVLRRMPPLGNF